MFVTVEGGKVTAIDRGGYGYDRSTDHAPVTLRRAFVSLEDGVVVRIDTGGHGYAR
jgi:hypothetical protein